MLTLVVMYTLVLGLAATVLSQCDFSYMTYPGNVLSPGCWPALIMHVQAVAACLKVAVLSQL